MTATIENLPRLTPLDPIELDPAAAEYPPSNVESIPPLAKQWQQLDFREILSRPAAFLSVSQSNSLYKPGGVQYAEGHALRGSLEATVKAVRAARDAPNFVSFNWIGFSVFREQTAFVGTDLPGTLNRQKVEVVVISGIHLDWCVEGNARAARDNGLLPIVIGDATGAVRPDQEPAAFRRINDFFAPVISSDQFGEWVSR